MRRWLKIADDGCDTSNWPSSCEVHGDRPSACLIRWRQFQEPSATGFQRSECSEKRSQRQHMPLFHYRCREAIHEWWLPCVGVHMRWRSPQSFSSCCNFILHRDRAKSSTVYNNTMNSATHSSWSSVSCGQRFLSSTNQSEGRWSKLTRHSSKNTLTPADCIKATGSYFIDTETACYNVTHHASGRSRNASDWFTVAVAAAAACSQRLPRRWAGKHRSGL